MITKPDNWKLAFCSGFLQGSAEVNDLPTAHRNTLNEVAKWLIGCVEIENE